MTGSEQPKKSRASERVMLWGNRLARALRPVFGAMDTAMRRVADWGNRLVVALHPVFSVLNKVLQRVVAWLGRVQFLLSGLQWILAFFLLAGVFYTVATPPLEAQDELKHYQLVRVLGNGGLPVQHPDAPMVWGEHASQPLLYYVLASLLDSRIDTSDFYTVTQPNPHARPRDWGAIGNVNGLLHDNVPAPPTGTALSVYLLRLINVGVAMVTLLAVHRVGQVVSPKRPAVALLAVGITAFNPMFVFTVAQVGNASLAIALNSLLIWACVRVLVDGIHGRTTAAIVLLVALGAVVHMATLALLPVVVAVWAYRARKDNRWAQFAGACFLLIWAFILLAGWWYYRNLQLYGDGLGLGVMVQLAQTRTEALTLQALLNEFAHFRVSYWGLFGAENLLMNVFLYAVFDLFTFSAILGVVFVIAQLYAIRDFAHARAELRVLVLLAGVLGAGMVAYFVWMLHVDKVAGAMLFPFMAATSPLLAVGFMEWVWWLVFVTTPLDRSYVRAGDAVPAEVLHPNAVWVGRWFAMVALLVPFIMIQPAYMPPAPLAEVPADITPVYARYGDIELVGYDVMNRRYTPSELVEVTFYWRAVAPIADNYMLSIALVDASGAEIGKVDSYPALGRLRTSRFVVGAVYADTYYLRLSDRLLRPQTVRVQATWWDDTHAQRLPIVDENARPLEAVLLDVGAVVSPSLLTQFTGVITLQDVPHLHREFGSTHRLEAFALDEQSGQFIAVWEAIGFTDGLYTAFVHVLGRDGAWLGGVDVMPALPTRYWRMGERFYTEHALKGLLAGLPPSEGYQLVVGLYDGVTGERAPLPEVVENPYNGYSVLTFAIRDDGTFFAPALEALRPPSAETTPEADVPVPTSVPPQGAPRP